MKKRIVWVVVSCLMALSLLMAACAPAVTEEKEAVAPPEEEAVTEEEVAPSAEEPVYGGVIKQMSAKDIGGVDPSFNPLSHALMLCNEELLTGDWSKGPAGTGEVSWTGGRIKLEVEIGCLAESWEIPDDETIIFHIRHGVHFHDKPPVNGRELNADDVALSLQRAVEMPFSYIGRQATPGDIKSVEATDKWTVVVKCRPEALPILFIDIADSVHITPTELPEQYGDNWNWEATCGTGPFMIVDAVSDSSAKYVRNPNYWRNDPVHPENTLPYVDGVDLLVIVDKSTQQAALRTGKIDSLGGLSYEERDMFFETSPHLKMAEAAGGGGGGGIMMVAMRSDILPFNDIRVRRAMAMAINNQEIVDEFYGGYAEILNWPIVNNLDFSDVYTPLEELPEEIRELFEYHPDKARQLLAEAGYPDGFKTEILSGSTEGVVQLDMLSILTEYWAKIGVEVIQDVRDSSMVKSMLDTRAHEEMCYSKHVAGFPHRLAETMSWNTRNRSLVNDPYLDEMYYRVNAKLLEPEHARILKEEYVPYVLKNAWYIPMPVPYGYHFWQPWLMGYHGEGAVGNLNLENWVIYVWIDQELKKEITGR